MRVKSPIGLERQIISKSNHVFFLKVKSRFDLERERMYGAPVEKEMVIF
jgi:hypothetical protein